MNTDDFDLLIESVRQAGDIQRGSLKPSREFHFNPAEVRQIRETLGLTQREFGLLIGVSVATLRNWEQGRRQPEGPARALLKIVSEEPELAARALSR